MDVSKLFKIKIVDADFKEIGKVKSFEVHDWKIVGLIVELSKEVTDLFFGKSKFRFSGQVIFLPTRLIENVGDIIKLNISGPILMLYSKLGLFFMNKKDQIKKEVKSIKDINKFSEKITRDLNSLLNEADKRIGVQEESKINLKMDGELIKNQLINEAYEKLGIDLPSETSI
ncbi:MAG: hypothetical protein ACTSYQ_00615 [Candidatus Odinarchaeia archaeon]